MSGSFSSSGSYLRPLPVPKHLFVPLIAKESFFVVKFNEITEGKFWCMESIN
uniref:Uncharacterized protein n=1 Tax=Brugia timori TaxID=42155 RepID=A0A0R3R515_9BILA